MTQTGEANRLLQAAQTGDRTAMARLFEEQRPWLTRFFVGRIGHREDGENLVQETFARASATFDAFRGDCPFSQWMLRIAQYALASYFRRDPYRMGRLVSMDPSSEASFALVQRPEEERSPSLQVQERAYVELLLRRMKESCSAQEWQTAVMAYEGSSFEEIAQVLQTNSATVRSWFARGRRKLIAHLVLNDPDLVGGREALERAWSEALRAESAEQRPTQVERVAWSRRKGGTEAFRSACLKAARYLALPLLLLAFWIDLRGEGH